jgi:ubiquinone biosynthesis protein COQ4
LAILDGSDPAKVLDAAFSVGDALGGMSDERHLRRMLESPVVQQMIVDKVSLVDALADHDSLGAMHPASLGRAFLAFSQRHGIDPRKLIESQHAMSRDHAQLDSLRQWLSDRLTVMHDLWHVLAGYEASTAGESALMCFSLPQRVNDRALPIFILMSVATRKVGLRDAIEAIRRGRKAVYLPAQPLEELLGLPLDQARERLGITPPLIAHSAAKTASMLIPI